MAKGKLLTTESIIIGKAKILKNFFGIDYVGTISGYDSPYYDILYEDGNSETMTINDLLPLISPTQLTPFAKNDKQTETKIESSMPSSKLTNQTTIFLLVVKLGNLACAKIILIFHLSNFTMES